MKFCVKCGSKFDAAGREVICPACRESAKAEAKRAAVLRAKKASWTGESVPVRISGRASTVIRSYGRDNNLPFAQALDDLLKASEFFKSTGGKWEDVEPYKSRRMKKSTETAQDKQDAPQEAQEVKTAQAAKVTSKSKSKPVKQATAAGKATSKTSASKK